MVISREGNKEARDLCQVDRHTVVKPVLLKAAELAREAAHEGSDHTEHTSSKHPHTPYSTVLEMADVVKAKILTKA